MSNHPVIYLGDDRYILWSGICDAPASYVMNRAQAIAAGVPEEDLDQAQVRGHSYRKRPPALAEQLLAFNRAGPDDCCLTVDAICRRYRSATDFESFTLQSDDIRPHITACYDGSSMVAYWVPWAPGTGPAEINADTDLHAMVRVTNDAAPRGEGKPGGADCGRSGRDVTDL